MLQKSLRAPLVALLLATAPVVALAQTGIGIGTTAPDVSAALDIVSSTKGALLPRVANATALATPATGLLVFQTSAPAGFYYNAGTPAAPNWQQIATATGATVTAGNGLTKTGQNVALGGTLSQATSIAQAGNTFSLTGGSVGIGTTTPHASAALDVSSTTKGLLPPRLSRTERDAIASPAAGLTIYNTTTNKINTWNGTSWDASLSATEQPYQGPTQTFAYTGAVQTYTVPAGVSSVTVTANGAQGASFYNLGGQTGRNAIGGQGARVLTTLTVTPGEVLNVYVGGAGAGSYGRYFVAGGWNGGGDVGATRLTGGSGGGATDLRRGATKLVVAGGGGGAGYANGANGGGGGAPDGLAGTVPNSGTGGTQTAGGSTGGSLGQGGASNADYSGAGGGGYYGGGGGSGGSGGSGGGGSSWVAPTGTTATVMTAGANPGNGSLTIAPVAQYAAPVLDAGNFVNTPWTKSGPVVHPTDLSSSVGIGTTAPHASAALDVSSTTKGLLPPRLSPAQRDAIASPATGLTIYNTTTNKVNTWNGTSWDESLTATQQPFQNPTQTYTMPGQYSYTVPAGVRSMIIVAVGAGGNDPGAGGAGAEAGGVGGRTQATLPVVPGQVLTVRVGGQGVGSGGGGGGGAVGGYNGGGNVAAYGGSGGGASDVRSGGTQYTDRVVVAGGGGGGAYASFGYGGNGGSATGAGTDGQGGAPRSTGATQTGPGSVNSNTDGTGGPTAAGNYGGAGGGGYFGGGGNSPTSGGGGGSSWAAPTCTAVSYGVAAARGNGSVTLTPAPAYAAPALDASNFVNVPTDNLGNHTATQNLNLGTNALVGNGGSTGLTISSGGVVTTAGNVQLGANQLVGNGGTSGLAVSSAGSVGIGGPAPASAALAVTSSTKGFLPPRLSQSERDAIAGPVAGLVVFNTTTTRLNTWNGTRWDESLSATQQPYQNPAQTFTYTGAVQTYTVPAGVTTLNVDARAAAGGSGGSSGNNLGGAGARVQATLSVSPGQVLQIRVGGAGDFGSTGTSVSGGYNGGGAITLGGAGGGATDVRTTGGTLADRLLVAGGGGGGGYAGPGSQGGGGGAPTGGNGTGGVGSAGTGATQAAGGSTGGGLGTGGAGSTYGGGGGGGYYGGGGGNIGGAGGGSSWVTPTGSSAITMTAGANAGNGSLTITPGGVYAAPALDASNFVNVPTPWTVSGADVYRAGGRVGIGTTAPEQKLTVAGGIVAATSELVRVQGAHLQWNRSGFLGETWLLNQKGLGSGGIYFGASDAVSSGANTVTEWARFDASGNLGLGTAPGVKLHVAGSVKIDGANTLEFGAGVAGKEANAGKIGYRAFSNDALDIVGAGNAGGGRVIRFYAENGSAFNAHVNATAFNTTSDARFKTAVRPIGGALASVLALRGVRYEWNALGVQHGGKAGAGQVGLLAQELEKIYPELVNTDAQGYKAVNYAQLTPVLIEALKEQQAQIEALKARAATAETELQAVKAAATATTDTFEARLRALEAGNGQARK